jgi:predicted nucleotidyltransferase component of viral defense system
MRLKVEINTREHFAVLGPHAVRFQVDSPWFAGETEIATFGIEELLGTKLRALYQRKKGRDLYDLGMALTTLSIDDAQVVACFERYMAHSRSSVARAEFEANLENKLTDRAFVEDVAPLLADPEGYDATQAAKVVLERLISKLPGLRAGGRDEPHPPPRDSHGAAP